MTDEFIELSFDDVMNMVEDLVENISEAITEYWGDKEIYMITMLALSFILEDYVNVCNDKMTDEERMVLLGALEGIMQKLAFKKMGG